MADNDYFDRLEIDWDEGYFIGYRGGVLYTYNIDEEPDLLFTMLDNGVKFTERGGSEGSVWEEPFENDEWGNPTEEHSGWDEW